MHRLSACRRDRGELICLYQTGPDEQTGPDSQHDGCAAVAGDFRHPVVRLAILGLEKHWSDGDFVVWFVLWLALVLFLGWIVDLRRKS